MNSFNLFNFFSRSISHSSAWKKAVNSVGLLSKGKKELLPVEQDTQKLANYVCGTNLFIEGGEDVKLKPDSDYPDWLWKIHSPPPLEELDPNTKTYWNRIRKIYRKEKSVLKKLQKNKTVHK